MTDRTLLGREQGEALIALLQELVVWTKLVNRRNVAEWFLHILDSDEKRVVYEYSDGERGVRDLGELTGLSKALVSAWWRDWEQLGIMQKSQNVPGRRQRMVSLEELGIVVPPVLRRQED
jgi:DNA-binding MarR family transcriptional regulator